MTLSPRETGKFIAKNAKFVKINSEKIKHLGDVLIDEVNTGRLKPTNFSQVEFHPKPADPYAIDWLLVVDTLNFCFWSNELNDRWKVDGYSGYYALCAAINRAMKDNVDILNPKFYSKITDEQLKKIFRSDTNVEVPLLPERMKCLHEVGSVLLEKFEGSFEKVVEKAENSAKILLDLIVNNFECFRDEAIYNGQKVTFYKRAQILVGDIWACFGNQGLGYFKDIDEITMFADYRVPQSLLWFGVFEYQKELIDKLEQHIVFKSGDIEELEIRGCSIHAVELLKEYANKKLQTEKINSVLIDHFLWDFRRRHAKEIEAKALPFHKVLSIFY